MADPKPVAVSNVDDHLGWHEQGNGKLFLGIPVENGRIKDEGSLRLFSGLKAFFERYRTPARLTSKPTWLLSQAAMHGHRLLTDGLAPAASRPYYYRLLADRKSTRLNSSHHTTSRMPSSA